MYCNIIMMFSTYGHNVVWQNNILVKILVSNVGICGHNFVTSIVEKQY